MTLTKFLNLSTRAEILRPAGPVVKFRDEKGPSPRG